MNGFPQTNLLRAWAPQLLPDVWMVGDSIFPGQSTAAVALGGLRVARSILAEYNVAYEIGAQQAPAFAPKAAYLRGHSPAAD